MYITNANIYSSYFFPNGMIYALKSKSTPGTYFDLLPPFSRTFLLNPTNPTYDVLSFMHRDQSAIYEQ